MLVHQPIPRHVAIVMDGNGRWAKKRMLPKIAGHKAGIKSLRAVVEHSIKCGIEILTVFAFSSENWNRPKQEVDDLMELFVEAIANETPSFQQNQIQLKFIGDCSRLSSKLQHDILSVTQQTLNNDRLILVIAMNYGGRWDITEAVRLLAQQIKAGAIYPEQINEDFFHRRLSTYGLPDPDLLIRTSNEYRISNFLLWQLAYTELFFCPELWPDFTVTAYQKVLDAYAKRERRFGS